MDSTSNPINVLQSQSALKQNVQNEAQMQIALDDLSSASEVIVSRSDGNGYMWTFQFVSDENGGDIDVSIVHSNSGGASVQVVPGGTDGSYMSCTFTVEFGK